jgi:hypothetical protein
MGKRGERVLAAVLATAAVMLIAASEPRRGLTPHEELLLSQIGFDRETAFIVKEETRSPVHRLSGFDEDGYQIMAGGVVVSVPQDRTEEVLASLRRRLAPRKYMAFIVEMNEGIRTDKIGVIPGTDQFDILRIMRTNGGGEDISHEDVMERLKEWEKGSPFNIIGAENDWVEIEFKALPKDVMAFVEDVYDFCPDVVDDGTGTIPELARELKSTKRLFLWWE